jgi:hypothetical protein
MIWGQARSHSALPYKLNVNKREECKGVGIITYLFIYLLQLILDKTSLRNI